MNSISFKIIDGAAVCTELCEGVGSLSVKIADAEKDGKVSLGGVFARLHGGCAEVDTRELPDGTHTLFLHAGGESTALCELEKSGGILSLHSTDGQTLALGKICARLHERTLRLEERLSALEKTAFESVVF